MTKRDMVSQFWYSAMSNFYCSLAYRQPYDEGVVDNYGGESERAGDFLLALDLGPGLGGVSF